MGKVYYDMGFLSTDEVIECSASDLIGQYVGQTGPKTKTQLERGLGKVLFIDEAYRLAEGQYATEAVNELIYLLTTPRYSGKMIVILGGYTADMNKLMNVRPGLSGRFPEEIEFSNIPTHECIAILSKELKDKKISAAFLDDPKNRVYKNLVARFRMLAMLPSWSNARDVKALAKEMAAAALNEAYKSGGSNGFLKDISLSEKQAKDCTTKMYEMQKARCSDKAEKCSSAENSGGGSPQAQTDTCTDTPMSFDIDTAPPAAFTSNASEASPAIATAATADIDVETAPSAFVNKGKGSGEEPTEATVDMEAESSKPSAVSLGKKKASEAAAATTADIEVEAESPEPSAVSLGKKKASEEEPEAAPAKEEEEPQKESDDPSQAQQTEPDEIVPKCIIRESEIEEDSENQLPKKKPPSQPELPSTPTADIEIAEEDIEEEEDEEVIESTQEEDGLCEAGYPWLKEGNGYRCGGGTHTRGDVGSGGTHISGTNGSFGRGNR